MDKKRQINFNLNNFLLATSSMLDYVYQQEKNVSIGHSKRVAYIALNIGIKLNLNPQELSDLCSFSLLHSLSLNLEKDEKLQFTKTDELIKKFPLLTKQNSILKYQKEYLDGSGVFGLIGNDIPLLAQILSLSISIDEQFDLGLPEVKNRFDCLDFVKKSSNQKISSKLVDVFVELSSKKSFWLDMQNENAILMFIYTSLEDFTITPTFEEVLDMTKIFHKIVDKDSKLIELSEKMADFYGFDHKDKLTYMISASLSNIGKLSISKEILQKNEPLNKYEKESIKSYPYYTKQVLSNIMGFNDILTWAVKIQERVDSRGYPYSLDGRNLSLKDRLLQVLNVYNALRQDRAYRKAYSHGESVVIMKEEASRNRLDSSIVNDIESMFEKYLS